MSVFKLKTPDLVDSLLSGEESALNRINVAMESLSAPERIVWALDNLPGNSALSSSFGIQSALMLHMVTRIEPDLPILLVDTGYLFEETYRYIDRLTVLLNLNLKVSGPERSAAWQQARHGKLWESGREGLKIYNRIHKIEPMQRLLEETQVSNWLTGLRRQQSRSRAQIRFVEFQGERLKINPVADWHNREVYKYLLKHDLPAHPLWEQGYMTVGDTHSSQPLQPGMLEEDTRFNGIQRECGLHAVG